MAARNGHHRVTMADVARRAGVSTAAVSKVLRNAYGVSPAMATRVRTAIDDLGYRPHAAARGLRGRTFTLGLLLPEIQNPFFGDILAGVTEVAVPSGYQVLMGAAGVAAAKQSELADAMVDRQMDGLVLVAPSMDRTAVELTANGTPTVVFGHHDRGYNFDSVAGDDRAGAALVVDHLVELGHRRIAHTAARHHADFGWNSGPDVVRWAGYEEAMHRHGLQPLVSVTSYVEPGGYEAAMELLTHWDRPTAIFAGADTAAMGVMRAAAQLGLEIPRDLSLVGYDNSYLADLAPVQLTSVDQGGRALGAAAASLLIERIDGRTEPQLVTHAPKLMLRRTTTAPAEDVTGGEGPGTGSMPCTLT